MYEVLSSSDVCFTIIYLLPYIKSIAVNRTVVPKFYFCVFLKRIHRFATLLQSLAKNKVFWTFYLFDFKITNVAI